MNKYKGPEVGTDQTVFWKHPRGLCNWNREKKRDLADEAREKTEPDLVHPCKTYSFYFEKKWNTIRSFEPETYVWTCDQLGAL